MTPLIIALGVSVIAMPGVALAQQHADHDMASSRQEQPADPHAGHDMASSPQEQPDDPHAGHAMGAEQDSSDPHAGHGGMMKNDDAPPVAPPPPEAFEGPEHAAASLFDPQLFERKRQEALIDAHGGYRTGMVLGDRLEYRARDGRDGYRWDVQGWYGGDYNRVWFRSEGEGDSGGDLEQAEVQALYARALNPWFNLQVGVRHDFRPTPERTHAVLGLYGLAPYWFEVDGSLFLSDEGDLSARFEAEYDQRITNRLMLQPAVEVDFAAQDVPELGIGAGLSSLEFGLRLRYEFVPEFAPYIGVEYERLIGDTADFARAQGEGVGGWTILIGLRSWF